MSSEVRRKKSEEATGRAGRPRCLEAHRAILDAADELLLELGYPNVTIEGIAARAGVGKMTIYRRWKSKAALVVDAYLEGTVADVPFPKSYSSVREAFRTQMKRVVRMMNGRRGKLLAMLIAYGQSDPELEQAFRVHWLAVRRAEGRPILLRGIEDGEIAPRADVDILLDALYGPLYFRLLVPYAPMTPAYVDKLVSIVFDGVEG